MTTRFKNAIDALVYAFFNDTLIQGECAACAVGNIVAHAAGKKLVRYSHGGIEQVLIGETKCGDMVFNGSWMHAFWTVNGKQKTNTQYLSSEAVLYCAEICGYSIDELKRIEFAFESHTDFTAIGQQEIENQYKGLMEVVTVLCEIEGIKDPTEYKELFALT